MAPTSATVRSSPSQSQRRTGTRTCPAEATAKADPPPIGQFSPARIVMKSHDFMHLTLQRRFGIGDESLLGTLNAGGWIWLSKRSPHHETLKGRAGPVSRKKWGAHPWVNRAIGQSHDRSLLQPSPLHRVAKAGKCRANSRTTPIAHYSPIVRLSESITPWQRGIYKRSSLAVRIVVRQTICRSIRMFGNIETI